MQYTDNTDVTREEYGPKEYKILWMSIHSSSWVIALMAPLRDCVIDHLISNIFSRFWE